jgi:quinol monooxygenase YgiN
MKRLLIALFAFAALTTSAPAQTPKAAVGSEQIYWVLTLAVDDLEKFKSVVQKLVVATQKEEPGTLEYEYTVADDQKTVDIVERYTNSLAVLDHLANFGKNFSKEFMPLVKPVRFVVYGVPTDELKKSLADFQPTYMTPFDGFTR